MGDFDDDHPSPCDLGIEKLFKFTRLSTAHPEYLQVLLAEGRLYFAEPGSFNDPWEARPHIVTGSTGALREYIIDVYQRLHSMDRDTAEAAANEKISGEKDIHTFAADAVQNVLDYARICSLSAEKENVLLWSHYAKSHKGICIEFDATQEPFKYAKKVKYQATYPKLHFPIDSTEVYRAPLTKSSDWSYEQEFRILANPNYEQEFSFDGEYSQLKDAAIIGIYLGCQISAENQGRILNWLSDGPFDPQIWHAQIRPDDFSLDFRNQSK